MVLLPFLTSNCFAVTAFNRGADAYQEKTIDASKNARQHNNMGNLYYQMGNYNNAFKEYELAYRLTSDKQGSSTYLYNMAVCATKIKNFKMAKYLVQEAIKKDSTNLTYYELLVDCYIALGTYKSELSRYLSNNTNPYNKIVAGLIYLKTGNKMTARTIFDEFIDNNPDMMVSDDLRAILRGM